MRKLIGCLVLMGCGSGYSVNSMTYDACVQKTVKLEWYCDHIRPLFWNDERVAVCNTFEECNRICADKRKD